MATLGQMTTKVSERLLDSGNIATSVQSVVDSINDSISYWKNNRFWFNEVTDSAFLTAGNGSFPYPSDFLLPVIQDAGFVIEYSNMRYPLRKISLESYEGQYLNNGFGIPRVYARIGSEEYQCYPLPDRDYEVRRHYLKDYVPLVNPSDTNDFTVNASRLIELWSLADLNAELRQDEKMELYYRNRANTEYQNLLNMTSKQNATGHLNLSSALIM